jgi:hypothetical protein
MTTTSTRIRTQNQLLSASRLGGDVARADLAGSPQHATSAMASWRRLRRYSDRDTRALLRIAFDASYGLQMQLSEPHAQI